MIKLCQTSGHSSGTVRLAALTQQPYAMTSRSTLNTDVSATISEQNCHYLEPYELSWSDGEAGKQTGAAGKCSGLGSAAIPNLKMLI